jgi:two-component system NarL family response regulator
VTKSSGTDQLFAALRAVSAGESFIAPEVARVLVRSFTPEKAGAPPPSSALGLREREVLQWVANGLSSAEIATRMGIAPATVETHRRNIKQKLGLHSTAELTRYAMREGLIAE